MTDLERLIVLLVDLFPHREDAPKQLSQAQAIQQILRRTDIKDVAKRRKPPTPESLQRSKAGIAQMMLGFLGEEYFETSARHLLATGRFSIQDDRSEGTGTDYLFLIVTVPSLPRSFLESHLSENHAWLASMSGRIVEEAIARQQLKEAWSERLYADIKTAEFRVISASKAFRLMHEKLFERVFALRVRAFNWTYKGAEVDMHLSLRDEMISFREFVKTIESRGVRETAIRLDRGEI